MAISYFNAYPNNTLAILASFLFDFELALLITSRRDATPSSLLTMHKAALHGDHLISFGIRCSPC